MTNTPNTKAWTFTSPDGQRFDIVRDTDARTMTVTDSYGYSVTTTYAANDCDMTGAAIEVIDNWEYLASR